MESPQQLFAYGKEIRFSVSPRRVLSLKSSRALVTGITTRTHYHYPSPTPHISLPLSPSTLRSACTVFCYSLSTYTMDPAFLGIIEVHLPSTTPFRSPRLPYVPIASLTQSPAANSIVLLPLQSCIYPRPFAQQ